MKLLHALVGRHRGVTTPPPPPPPPAPAPSIASSAYRNQQPQLFQTVRAQYEPDRLSSGNPLANENSGPTGLYVDAGQGWAWDNAGGDFLDSTGTRMGTSPFFAVALGAVSGGAAVHAYTVDVTSFVQFVQVNGRWNAMLLDGSNATPRAIAGPFSTTSPAPSISVTYVGGATATLNCRIVAANNSSSVIPSSTAPDFVLPCFAEFDRPAGPVASATMSFTITQHWSGAVPSLQGFVLDPPINAQPVGTGIAASYGYLDAGMGADASLLGMHRYLDGTSLSDFALAGTYNIDNEDEFDPAIYGRGATDLTKLPHISMATTTANIKGGKWVALGTGTSLVSSSYTGEGFQPLAPGLGALRINMPIDPNATGDGAIVPYVGTLGEAARIYMSYAAPDFDFGNLDEIWIRYYYRLGTPNGSPYSMPIAKKYQYRHGIGAPTFWESAGGKMGIMPDHVTTAGGVSATSGGGMGWQNRAAWADYTGDDVGPNVNGILTSMHTFDYGANQPAGHRYGGTEEPKEFEFGQIGGLGGTWYGNTWYCFEYHLLLNSVDTTYAGFSPDGMMEVWLDGRLVMQRTNQVLRTLPINAQPMTASCSGTTLTVTDVPRGVITSPLSNIDCKTGGVISSGTYINGFVSGTLGGPGVYTLNNAQTPFSSRNDLLFNYIPYSSGHMRACQTLAIRSLWHNFFDGGLGSNSVQRTVFVSGLAFGKSRIGPMRFPPMATFGFTTPASGTVGQVSTNTLADTATGGSGFTISDEQFSLSKVLGAWGTSSLSLVYTGSVLSDIVYYIFGGGHGDTGNNGVYCWRASTGMFHQVLAPEKVTISGTVDVTHGENTTNRPDSQHPYFNPKGFNSDEAGGEGFVLVYGTAVGQGAISSGQAHRFSAASVAFSRFGDLRTITSTVVQIIIKDTKRRIFWTAPSDTANTDYFTLDYTLSSPTWQTFTMPAATVGGWGAVDAPGLPKEACGTYDPGRDLYIAGVQYGTGTPNSNLCLYDPNNPSDGWSLMHFTGTGPTNLGAIGLMYRSTNDTFLMLDTSTSPPTAYFVLTPPSSSPISGTWTWSRVSFTGTSTFNNYSGNAMAFERFQYVPVVDAIIYCPRDVNKMEMIKL